MIESLTGQGINVRHACRVLGVSESGYYDWKDRPDPPRTLRRIWLAGEIADVHKASGGTYGYMRVTAELRHGREVVVGHNTVGKIMGELGIKGLPTRRLPKGARMAQVTSLDLVCREFRRDGPNQLWMTDITEHPTREGKIYCCVVLDAFSRLIVGWSVESTQTTVLVTNALGMATIRRERAEGLVIHSDRGVQFTSWAFSRKVRDAGLAPSMGAVGSAYDCDDAVLCRWLELLATTSMYRLVAALAGLINLGISIIRERPALKYSCANGPLAGMGSVRRHEGRNLGRVSGQQHALS